MILLMGMFLLLAQGGDPVKHFPAKDVEAAMAKPAPTLDKGDKYTVMINRRTAPGQPEVHAVDTDVFYVVDGSASFTTGGTVDGGKTTAPGEIRGTKIKGGKVRRLSKGDVITIPNGVPHWFSEVQGSVTYFIVKIATGPAASK